MISYLMGKEGESDQNGGVDQQDGNLGDRKGTRDRKEGKEGSHILRNRCIRWSEEGKEG